MRETGVVLRCGDEVLFAEIVEDAMTQDPELQGEVWRTRIVGSIRRAGAIVQEQRPDHLWPRDLREPVPIAVEDVVAPNPHMGLTNVSALIETARLVGYLQAVYPVVLVPPGGHGKAPLQTYPAALVGPRETAGTGRRRHLRSAWDVAGAASGAARIAAALKRR